MEVNESAQLVLRDLGVLHGGDLGEPVLRDAEVLGDQAAELIVNRFHSSVDHHCHTRCEP